MTDNNRSMAMKILRLPVIALGSAAIATFASPLIWSAITPLAAASSPTTQPQLISVPVADVVVRRMAPSARFTGHLEALRHVEITPRVSGLLTDATFREGGRVRKGDVLFRIDPEAFVLKVDAARAAVERAVSLAEQAEADLARAAPLSGSGAISKKARDDAAALHRSRKAELAAARVALRQAELELSWTEIRSPIDGLADRVLVEPGNQVAAGPGSVLTKVIGVDQVHVTFHIDESTYLRLSAGDLAGLTAKIEVAAAEEGRPIAAKLDFGSAEVDRSTGTLRVRAVVDNPAGYLKPGMFVRVQLPLEPAAETVLVNEAAIGTAPGGRYVLSLDEKNTVVLKPIRIGASEGDLRVVEHGLSPRDRVILKGPVRPGMTVDPKVVSMPGNPLPMEDGVL